MKFNLVPFVKNKAKLFGLVFLTILPGSVIAGLLHFDIDANGYHFIAWVLMCIVPSLIVAYQYDKNHPEPRLFLPDA